MIQHHTMYGGDLLCNHDFLRSLDNCATWLSDCFPNPWISRPLCDRNDQSFRTPRLHCSLCHQSVGMSRMLCDLCGQSVGLQGLQPRCHDIPATFWDPLRKKLQKVSGTLLTSRLAFQDMSTLLPLSLLTFATSCSVSFRVFVTLRVVSG